MIRFVCPACNGVVESPESAAGSKLPCPHCGQRLQIPYPPNKTVLGSLLPVAPSQTNKPQPPRLPLPSSPQTIPLDQEILLEVDTQADPFDFDTHDAGPSRRRADTGVMGCGVFLGIIVTVGVISCFILYVIQPQGGLSSNSDPTATTALVLTVALLTLVVAVPLALFYFLPTFIARTRGHQNAGAIFFVNLLLGWSLLGWIAALAWSLTAVERRG
jgi:hypothetical protein